jgi:prepilin-type N-terminal cleavage/methylation domain-containing protein
MSESIYKNTSGRIRSGFTLIELVVATAISTLLVLVVGILLVGGQRFWQQTYSDSQKQIRQDAQTIMIKFGSMGRKSNRISSGGWRGYKIYTHHGDTTSAPTNPGTLIADGNAVELGYWNCDWDDAGFNPSTIVDKSKACTDYVEFYLTGNTFKAEYGVYDYGHSGQKVPARTEILAQNAYAGTAGMGIFSHTTDISGNGKGSVRISLKLTDPVDGEVITIKTAALLRVIWPR